MRLVGIVLLAGLLVASMKRSPFTPPSFFIYYWMLCLCLMWVFYPTALAKAAGVIVIVVFTLCLAAGAYLTYSVGDRQKHSNTYEESSSRNHLSEFVFPPLAAISLAAGLYGGYVAASMGRISVNPSLTELANSIAVQRYSGDLELGVTIPIMTTIIFTAALVCPLALLNDDRFRWAYVCAPFIAILPYTIVTTARLAMLIVAAFTLSGLVATYVLRHNQFPRVSPRVLLASGAILSVAAVFFLFGAYLRVGAAAGALSITLDRVQLYAVGSVPAFTQWYDSSSYVGQDQPLGFGAASIAGGQILSGVPREAFRAYEEFTAVDREGSMSNIYTMFRGLIMDFGVVGCAIACLFVGAFSGWAATRTLRGSLTASICLSAVYGTVLLSAWMSILTFTSVMASIIASVVLVKLASSLSRPVPSFTPLDDNLPERAHTEAK